MTLRLPCAIVESPWRHKHIPFVNIASLRSRSIKCRQWKHKLDYYGVVFAHLATGCGIKAKDPSGLDSDRWIPHSRCCENPARAKALAGFSRHLSAGFTDLNLAPRGLSLLNHRCFQNHRNLHIWATLWRYWHIDIDINMINRTLNRRGKYCVIQSSPSRRWLLGNTPRIDRPVKPKLTKNRQFLPNFFK